MLAKFRHRYPQGSLVSELVEIDRGTYIVKAMIQVDSVVLATALAGADTVEAAEDAARERAIATLFLDAHSTSTPRNQTAPTPASQAELSVNSVTKQQINEPKDEPKIVNFSQPKSRTSEPAFSAVEDPVTTPPIPEPQSNLEPGIEESVPVTSAENNLFGDTYSAEIPTVASLSDDSLNNSSDNSSATATATAELDAMDFNEIKQKTDIEIRRLGWSKDQGKEFLMSHYGKRSRLHLTDEQLLEFLRYLEKLPNPVS